MAKRKYYRNGVVRWLDDEGHAYREGGPAVVWHDGSQWWCRRDQAKFPRGPADLCADGTLQWYEGDHLLREREPYG